MRIKSHHAIIQAGSHTGDHFWAQENWQPKIKDKKLYWINHRKLSKTSNTSQVDTLK